MWCARWMHPDERLLQLVMIDSELNQAYRGTTWQAAAA